MNRLTEKIIGFFINILTFGFFNVQGKTHREMVKGDNKVKKLKRVSYKEWREAMSLFNWTIDTAYHSSLFTSSDAYAHASIYRFGDIGYILTDFGAWRASMYIRSVFRKQYKLLLLEKPYID